MSFISVTFLLFVSIVAILYFIIPMKHRWLILLLSSILFYVVAGWSFVPFVFATALFTYICGRLVNKYQQKIDQKVNSTDVENVKKELRAKGKRRCRRLVIVCVLLVLAMLAYSKFGHYIVEAINKFLTGIPFNLDIIVPLGISYYTFSSIGYILDVYWRRYGAEKNFFKYFLYLLYFPHILQGPIPRYNKLAPQLIEGHAFDYTRVCFGLQLMVWGYFKKMVIADRLAIFVTEVYSSWQYEEGVILVVATLFYAIQLYADFSGCMDIASGFSEVLGIHLDKNFKQPYFAQSVEEYWRRWHITLGKWFKDYLCMPVTVSGFVKNSAAKVRKKHGSQAGKNYILIVTSIVVWLATGIWHGTGWNYIVWGIWNGTIIVCSSLLSKKYKIIKEKLHIDDTSSGWRDFRIIRTFILAAFIPRVLTRSGSVAAAIGIFKNMFSVFNVWVLFDGSLYDYGLDRKDFWVGIIAILILFGVSVMKEKGIQIREMVARKGIVTRWVIYYLAFLSIILFGMYGSGYGVSTFIYMNF